ncbi:hypothetical protein [Mumia sp. DW29H23]|uniref:hypothetical protein n=1 Tax=Mumia sp. DW29H23 TaxID=3421241 RepID=UPI003D695FC1
MPDSRATTTLPGPATAEGDARLDSTVLIGRLRQRCSTSDDFPVARGSSLAADDIASGPYATSQVLRRCVTAGIDHLQAGGMLGVGEQVPHVAATWSLARGALESLATAYWILGPDRRDERVERTLRWHAQDITDAEEATRHLGLPNVASAESRLVALDAVARRRALDPEAVRRGCTATEAVEYAEVSLPHLSMGVRLPWQLSSGFAHGRPWAHVGATAVERTVGGRPNVVDVRRSSAAGNALYANLAALQLLEAFVRLYEQRANHSLV